MKSKWLHKKFLLLSVQIAVLLALAGFLIFIHLKNIPYSFDDSYIHFRIAKHFVETGYPYFNTNEAVMASSSSAWTIILFLLFAVWGVGQAPAAVLNAVSCVAGAVVYYQLAKALNTPKQPAPFLYAIPVVYLCIILPVSLGLMETSISMAVCGLALLLFVKKKPFSLVLFGALPFFRYEFVFLTGIFVLYSLTKRIFPFRTVILYVLLGSVPFLVYEYGFFQTFLPNSVIAKSNGYDPGFVQIFSSLLSYAFPTLGPYPLSDFYSNPFFRLVLLSLLLTLLLLTIYHRRISLLDLRLLILANGLLVCVFFFVGNSLIFPWYSSLFLIPIYVGLLLLFAKENLIVKLILALAVLPIALSAWYTVYGVATGQCQYVQFFDQNARVAKYIALGKELYQQYPHAVLATSEIGGLGWGFEGYIADGFGLASPDAIRFQNKRKNGLFGVIAKEYVEQIKPELIVSMDIFDRSLREGGSLSNYQYHSEPIYLPEDWDCLPGRTLWGATRMNVFIRNDVVKRSP